MSKHRGRKGRNAEPAQPATVHPTSAPKQPTPSALAPVPEPRSAVALWLLAALLTFWSFGFTTMMGSDLWWHLASGRWIWETRTLNFKDPMACEWLASMQARNERLAEAELTLGRCQRLFPDRARHQELIANFRTRAETPP